MSDPWRIGTRRWYALDAKKGPRGVIDHILRLLEQEDISRTKARELIEYAVYADLAHEPVPPAPWHLINWGDWQSYCALKPPAQVEAKP